MNSEKVLHMTDSSALRNAPELGSPGITTILAHVSQARGATPIFFARAFHAALSGLRDFMPQRIRNFFGRILRCTILSNLNPSRQVIARTLLTFCLGPSECLVVQPDRLVIVAIETP